MDPECSGEEEYTEIAFRPIVRPDPTRDSPPTPQLDAFQPHPIIPQDLMDNDGNLRATDIGITWAGSDTFLHRVKVVGLATSTPHQPTGPRLGTSGEQTGLPTGGTDTANKSLNWPSWFRHFRAVSDVHGWDKSQRALQLVSYLDETAMNVAQELGDDELYDYDILVKLLGDRFDPASRTIFSHSM